MHSKLIKDFFKEIYVNRKRFISIVLIVMLGVGFFSGIKATTPSMKYTAHKYFEDSNFMDFTLKSTLGFTDSSIDILKNNIEEIENIYPISSKDMIINLNNSDKVIKVFSIDDNVNKLNLVEGEFPTNSNEILVDSKLSIELGSVINTGNDDFLKSSSLTVVGKVESPPYISVERGNSNIGDGKITGFIYVSKDLINSEVYTDLYITLKNPEELLTYSDDYSDYISSIKSKLEDLSKELNDDRYNAVVDAYVSNQVGGQGRPSLQSSAISSIVEYPTTYIFTRADNIGYSEYKDNSEKIDAIGKVFPIIFFVVSALVCLTSMTRMVEEQRLQIGTLKALGYSNFSIAMKYIAYAILATIIGSILGVIIGVNVIPRIIANAYSIMYNLPKVSLSFSLDIPITAGLASLGCTLVATIYSCVSEMRHTPSVLMRPKSPKKGKRIFLEKIKFIWNHLNFSKKVTCRNIFRYKKKFYMTIIGIAGCTALVVTGFGIKDSVTALVPKQFDNIYKFNLQIGIKENQTLDTVSAILEENNVNYSNVKLNSADVTANGNSVDAYILVAKDSNTVENVINLQSRTTKEALHLNSNSVIITEKLSELLNVSVGDKIQVPLGDKRFEVEISAIAENYVYHYVYMDSTLYEELTGNPYECNMIFANAKMNETEQNELSTKLLEENSVSSVVQLDNSRYSLDKTFDSLNAIVWVLIISAAALAFVVLYNLSNTNISERIREIATIKVLGFYDKEVSSYIYRESTILTAIGIVLGLVIGYFLEGYVIKTCEVDLIMFGNDIKLISYIYAIAITILCTIIVNIFIHFSLKKVNMIESLKSVE